MNKAQTSLSELKFYLTAPFSCSYLPEREACSLFADPDYELNNQVYSRLAQHGFRRSGALAYRPHCKNCQACTPIRVLTNQFQPSRTQKRAWKKHQNLNTQIHTLSFNQEHYELYLRYQKHRHKGGGMDEDNPDAYKSFLLKSSVDSLLVEFRENGVLRMVSLIDILHDGLSSVYTFYEPAQEKTAYGVFNVLWQIELCRQLQLNYLYLGYWIKDCRKMSYKTDYQPTEGWVNENWSPLEKTK